MIWVMIEVLAVLLIAGAEPEPTDKAIPDRSSALYYG